MSEQNPYAPVGTPGMIPPPPPMNGFAPAPAQSYDHPGMTLTELSFAPVPTDAPPAPVEPQFAGPGLVSDVLPTGGVARKLSLGGGKTPLIALLVVALLAGAGVFFGTDLFKSKSEPPAFVPKKKVAVAPKVVAPSAPAVVAPVKPKAVKPVVKPLAGKPMSVTAVNSRTFGGTYTVTQPTGWTAKLKSGRVKSINADLVIANAKAGQAFHVNSLRPSVYKGPLTEQKFAALQAVVLAGSPTSKHLPGAVKATVAGAKVSGFDAQVPAGAGPAQTTRTVIFEHGGVVYVAGWSANAADFAKSLPTFNQLLASVKFAK